MNNTNEFLPSNVVPIRKSEKFGVYTGVVTSSGEVIEGESVGVAYLKTGSKKFRLKLFTHPITQYFVVPDETNNERYLVLSLEEYQVSTGEMKSSWYRVGEGKLVGSFIALRIQLLSESLFLCLFPEKPERMEDSIAS